MDKKERKVQGHALRAEKKVGMYSLENDEAHYSFKTTHIKLLALITHLKA